MRQLRQASALGYNAIGRSHENLREYSQHSPLPAHREPLRRYASAQTLPNSAAFRGSPVVRISGDFEDLWSRHTNTALHKPVYGRGTRSVACVGGSPYPIRSLASNEFRTLGLSWWFRFYLLLQSMHNISQTGSAYVRKGSDGIIIVLSCNFVVIEFSRTI